MKKLISIIFLAWLVCACEKKHEEPTFIVKDYDGNIYNVVRIGDQFWTLEDIKATHYADGRPIKETSDSATKGVHYHYNWFELTDANNKPSSDNDASSYTQGVCPDGWHIPSAEELIALKQTYGLSQIKELLELTDFHVSLNAPSVYAAQLGLDYFYYYGHLATTNEVDSLYFYGIDENFKKQKVEKRHLYRVRCVKDIQDSEF